MGRGTSGLARRSDNYYQQQRRRRTAAEAGCGDGYCIRMALVGAEDGDGDEGEYEGSDACDNGVARQRPS